MGFFGGFVYPQTFNLAYFDIYHLTKYSFWYAYWVSQALFRCHQHSPPCDLNLDQSWPCLKQSGPSQTHLYSVLHTMLHCPKTSVTHTAVFDLYPHCTHLLKAVTRVSIMKTGRHILPHTRTVTINCKSNFIIETVTRFPQCSLTDSQQKNSCYCCELVTNSISAVLTSITSDNIIV